MKIVVLSDLHYPQTCEDELKRIIVEERADKIIFLGDSVEEEDEVSSFLELIFLSRSGNGDESSKSNSDVLFVRGDDDSSLLPCKNSIKINLGKCNFTFLHGHQFDIGSESLTKNIASLLRRVNGRLPLLIYSIVARTRNRTKRSDFLILGHTHALEYFPRLRVACAGCLTNQVNLYNDRGYIVIEESTATFMKSDNLSLRLESLSQTKKRRIFQI